MTSRPRRPPRRPMPRRKPTATRRAEIADAAMRVIAERGARQFTARVLAREVGITDGAVFRHFASMDAVVDTVVERMEVVLFSDAPPADADPVERLGRFFRRRVTVLLANPHLARLLNSDQLSQLGGPEQARRVEDFKARTRRFITACLAEASAAGLLRGGVGPREGAILVQGAVFALGHGGGAVVDGEKVTAAIWRALERMLRGAGPESETRRSRR